MKKYLLLAALALGAVGASAEDAQEASKNAVCITLKSGATQFVAFTKQPVISAANGKLTLTSAADQAQLAVAELSDVATITAQYHDFATDGVAKVKVDGGTAEEVFNLDGTRATRILPGKVYVIKAGGKAKKVVKQ